MYILTSTSTARPCAGGPLQAVSWCLLPAPWSSTAALEDGGLEAAADGDPPQCWEKASGWTGSVGLTQPSPGNISPCHEALLRTSQRKRNNINHITSIFIFQFHSTYIKYDLDIEIGL